MSAVIPFFSDLPPKAIKAANRLWDAIQAPGYNGVQAYNDFCHDLTVAGIVPAPPRAIVRRWQAGVQGGMIARPEPIVAMAADPQPDPYKPAPKGAIERVRELSRREAERNAAKKPPLADVFVKDETTGAIVQPEVSIALDAETRMAVPAEVSATDVKLAESLASPPPLDTILAVLCAASPAPPPAVEGAALVAVKAAAGRLLEETVIGLSRSIERTAREATARMLREVADELEGGAV